jgi:hypothetical protein
MVGRRSAVIIIFDNFLYSDFPEEKEDPTQKMLDYFFTNISFKHWFTGHFHFDKDIEFNNKKLSILYDKGKVIE